jgi:hypothetical protein
MDPKEIVAELAGASKSYGTTLALHRLARKG